MSFSSPFGFSGNEQALRQRVAELEHQLRQLEQQPSAITTVVAFPAKGRGLLAGNPPQEIPVPDKVKIGSQLRLIPGTSLAVQVLDEPVAFGPVVAVISVEGERVEVDCGGGRRDLLPMRAGVTAKVGDRAVLDPCGSIVLQVLPGGGEAKQFALATKQAVSWDDVGGQEEAKAALREAIEYPVRYADVYKAHGQKPTKGALLYGPAGTGKTLLAKALATSLGGDTEGFLYVKGGSVASKFVGESERNIRALFEQARAYKAKSGKPAVLFIDEADAVLKDRARAGLAFAGNAPAIVETFLAEMDGLDDAGAFVLLATNKPEMLDPAVVREGRCDHKVHVKRPDKATAVSVFKLALRGRRAGEGLGEYAAEQLFSDRQKLLELTYVDVPRPELVLLSHLASGAMIEGIVQKAAALAIKRDRESGSLSDVGQSDIDEAVKTTLRQQARINHDEVVAELSKSFGKMPTRVRRLIDG